MSGQKKLDRATRAIRVVAIPSRVIEKEGKQTQLYKIKEMY